MRVLRTLALLSPLGLAACADPAPHSVALPSHTVGVVSTVPVDVVRPQPIPSNHLRIHPHPTHPSPAYEPIAGCTSWNTAYAMHAMAGKYECAVLYRPGTLSAYRFVVFRDPNGLAYTTNHDGRWIRNPSYDGYVNGDQPHR